MSRVLIADDHNLIVDAFRKLLEPSCEVVGTVSDGRALLTAARDLRPDVIVLDVAMPLLNGLDAGYAIKKMDPSIKLVYVTAYEDPDIAAQAIRIGSGYLLKRSAGAELPIAVREATMQRSYVTPLITDGVVRALTQEGGGGGSAEELTFRQREVLQLLAEGKSMKEVATILDITPATVAFHKYRMMDQLGIRTSAELVKFAVQHHLVH